MTKYSRPCSVVHFNRFNSTLERAIISEKSSNSSSTGGFSSISGSSVISEIGREVSSISGSCGVSTIGRGFSSISACIDGDCLELVVVLTRFLDDLVGVSVLILIGASGSVSISLISFLVTTGSTVFSGGGDEYATVDFG